MTNGGDFDETRFVVHRIEDPVVADSDSVKVHGAEFDAPARSRVFAEGYDGTIDSLENGIGQSFKFSPG